MTDYLVNTYLLRTKGVRAVWSLDIVAAHKDDLQRLQRTIDQRQEYNEFRALDRLERRLAVVRARIARLTTRPGTSSA